MKIVTAKRAKSSAILLLLGAIAQTAGLGCGVKSAPIPPQFAKPERILDLEAVSTSAGIRLTWHRPDRYVSGVKMTDLAGFAVERSEAAAPMQPVARIPVTDQGRFQVQRIFNYQDSATTVGTTYRYRVVSRTSDGDRSAPSNEVTIVRRVPPPPPSPENFVLPTPTPPR